MSLVRKAFSRGAMPDPSRTVSQWADDFRVLSQEASSEPGRWRTSRTPYLKAIMDALSPQDPCEQVTFIKGAQVGGTEAGNNWCGYVIDYSPGPMLMVQPTDDMVERVSKQRLTPMIEASKRLKEKVTKDNIHEKIFPGGMMMLTTAKSAAGLRSMPVKYLFLDEVDGYPIDVQGEGDPIGLAIARTRTFPRRKIYMCSTPTIKGRSRIEAAWESSSQQRLHVPCPSCGCMSPIEWEHIVWPKDQPEKARWKCPECKEAHDESRKTWMLTNGVWVAARPEISHNKGFHLSGLYSPVGWYSWADAARQWASSTEDQDRLRVFINTVLGETWEVRGDSPQWGRLYDRREAYEIGTVPSGALILTAGVDVQKDRLECEVVGWGPGLESWSVAHEVIPGDVYDKATWDRLTGVLQTRWPHADGGDIEISTMAVDSGFATTEVYKWARSLSASRVMVVKGQSAGSGVILGRTNQVEPGVWLTNVNVDQLKAELYGFLRLRPITDDDGQISGFPPGYCHFPMYGQEYFEQITAEKQVASVNNKGFQVLTWVKDRARNEALDLRNYARAAAERLQVSRFQEKEWSSLRDRLKSSTIPRREQARNGRSGRRRRRDTRWIG